MEFRPPHGGLQPPHTWKAPSSPRAPAPRSNAMKEADIGLRIFGPGPPLPSFPNDLTKGNMTSLMSQACERCWRRKQKCDRRRPICQQCQLVSATCFERRHGTVLDPSDPASQLSYIEALKRKVQLLELQTGQQASPHQSQDESASPASDARTGSERRTPWSSVSRAAGCRDSIQAEMGSLSLAAMAESTGEQPLLPRARPFLSFETLLRSSTGVAASNLSRSDTPNPALHGAFGDFHRALLRQGLQLNSIDTQKPFDRYLDMSIQCFPFIERTQLMEEYAIVSRADLGNSGELLASSPGQIVRTYVAVATGILLTPDFRHMETFATSLALTAQQHIPRVDGSSRELETVQCLIAIAVFSLFTSFGGSTWHLLGLALSRCVSAGMHHIRVSDAQSDDEEKRGSSRAFWCLYVLDTLVSASLDRPFFVQDEDITTLPPSHNSSSSGDFEIFHRTVVQGAKLLRDTQRNPEKGALFHFINMQHFRETLPRHPSGLGDELCNTELCVYGLRWTSRLPDRGRAALQPAPRELWGNHSTTQPILQKCLRLLVAISERFSSVRSLREILEQLVVVLLATKDRHTHADWLSLERRIESSEIPTPRRVEDLINSLRINTPSPHISG
ncbi:uncharacterized protein PG998_001158 [Apiospora kogelbergensis]|uniref:uncharacterized protein n=1 Tax=Apiospora kogelbergensis TaxID=1337665 RepID=UPI00312D0127